MKVGSGGYPGRASIINVKYQRSGYARWMNVNEWKRCNLVLHRGTARSDVDGKTTMPQSPTLCLNIQMGLLGSIAGAPPTAVCMDVGIPHGFLISSDPLSLDPHIGVLSLAVMDKVHRSLPPHQVRNFRDPLSTKAVEMTSGCRTWSYCDQFREGR